MDISQILTAVVLGIVEGITEFLPISSTGHLILFNEWFKFSDPSFTKMFDIVIQTGAILAVIIYFRKKLFPIYKEQSLEIRKDIRSMWLKAIIGFLPAVVVSLFAYDFIQANLMKPLIVAAAFIVWGIIIIVLEYRNIAATKAGHQAKLETVANLTIPIVIAIGLIQCLAIVPGTSRSAATIVGAMLLGASRVAAAEFSFFLAIPTLLGAGAYSMLKFLKAGIHLSGSDIISLVVGTVVSFAVAWIVVAAFMNFIRKHDFRGFGWYRIILGIVIICWFAASGRTFG